VDYVFIPHPDDEIEGWAAFQSDRRAYPLFIVLTRGEATVFCDVANYAAGWQPFFEELPAIPVPRVRRSGLCAQARIDSFNAFMDAMAAVDPEHDDAIGRDLPRTGRAPSPPPGCRVRSTQFRLWIGAHHARLVLDAGDGSLRPCHIPWALQVARNLLRLLPVRSEGNAIGDGYYGPRARCGAAAYTNSDHYAVYEAMRKMKLGVAGKQWQLVCADDSPSVYRVLPGSIRDFAFPSITGEIERHYGWLSVSRVPADPYCCYPFQYAPQEYFAVTPS